MNTLENNKLIAEFMGFQKAFVFDSKGKPYDYSIQNGFSLIKEVETTIEGVSCEVLEEQDYCKIEDLKFDYSWDWLIPVIQKISYIKGFNLLSTIEEICKYEGGFNSIDDLYNSAINFINWYNENNN